MYRGDPGILGSLFRFGKGVVRGAVRGGPIGGVVGGISGIVSGGGSRPSAASIAFPGGGSMRAAIGERGRGGKTGKGRIGEMNGRKSRRMNVANPKALRRAIRRQTGFVKLAKKALKGTGYTVVSRSSTRKRYNVREAGPGGVTIQN